MSICLIALTVLSCKSMSGEQLQNPSQDLLLSLQKLQIRIIYCCACCHFWLMRRLHFPVTCSFDGTPEILMIILSPVTRYFTTGWHALQLGIKDAYPSKWKCLHVNDWMCEMRKWQWGRRSLRLRRRKLSLLSAKLICVSSWLLR